MPATQRLYKEAAREFKEQRDIITLDNPNVSLVQSLMLDTIKGSVCRMAVVFKWDNPNFNADKFFRACGLPELADN
jgi:hypothetical protein